MFVPIIAAFVIAALFVLLLWLRRPSKSQT